MQIGCIFQDAVLYIVCIGIYIYIQILLVRTSSTAQGGGGSFKNRKRIGDWLL